MIKDNQGPLLEAQASWFHIFKSMLEGGDVAKMGPHATTVYLAVKAYTNWSTGKAWPGIDLITEKTGISKKQTEEFVSAFIDTVTEELKIGGEVVFTGFGKFEVVERAAREGRNPATGEPMHIESSLAAKFKAGKALKDAIKGA